MDFNSVLLHLKNELATLRTGRAHPSLVESMEVEVYGSMQMLKGVASIGVQDNKTLAIQPWDKSIVKLIEKAIIASDLGVAPQSDGVVIRITLPALTEERRKEFVKKAYDMGEHAKITVRNMRRDEMERIKAKDDVSEDIQKREQDNLQEEVNQINKDIDLIVKKKEEELLTV